jgi:hypothetical protein
LYVQRPELQKEAKEDNIIGIIRAGIAMHLKEAVGPPNILVREQKIAK